MKTDQNAITWAVRFDPDRLDSALGDLRVLDASPASMTHPQGPVTIAIVNLRAFAPHVEIALQHAARIAAAPALERALRLFVAQYEGNGADDRELRPEMKAAREALAMLERAPMGPAEI